MIEIPEAQVLADQLTAKIAGKTYSVVEPNRSPHKFAFFHGDPLSYQNLLGGQQVDTVKAHAGQIEISAGDTRLVFSDGVNIRWYAADEELPDKHQLRISFTDGSSIICTIQMYGMMFAFSAGTFDNPYYEVAKTKPNPLVDTFDMEYYSRLLDDTKPGLSVKAVLATEQRIPGLGNGVLQDILFNARVNPRSKLAALTDDDKAALFASIKNTLRAMTENGGRDTEKDLFGNPGGYEVILSSKSFEKPCPVCGGKVKKEAYLGGSVYYCPNCQPEKPLQKK